ncbi:MAG: TetR/AcrR family transcriptional regulator [Actinomycetales bacterium]|nr:MAG: TetR/AcrR family transcriptional regulator [Actinomycetales bacterium]
MSGSAYHHGDLRRALVDAAFVAARSEGPEGVSIRELARRVGVSHNAAYRHFAHRDELLVEVSGLAMQALVDAMEERLARVDETDGVLRARRRLAEIGRAYVSFALGEPGLFRVAFSSHPEMDQTSLSALAVRPYTLLGEALDGLVEVGFLSPSARVEAEMTCWSAVHGFALLNSNPLRDLPAEERELALDRVLAAIDRSYAATTGSVITPGDVFLVA